VSLFPSRVYALFSLTEFIVEGDTMKATADKIDLAMLPDDARREVFDFYRDIVKRYGLTKKASRPTARKKLPVEFYRPIAVKGYCAVTRDEIYNEV